MADGIILAIGAAQRAAGKEYGAAALGAGDARLFPEMQGRPGQARIFPHAAIAFFYASVHPALPGTKMANQ